MPTKPVDFGQIKYNSNEKKLQDIKANYNNDHLFSSTIWNVKKLKLQKLLDWKLKDIGNFSVKQFVYKENKYDS